jgi:hypothetical protein
MPKGSFVAMGQMGLTGWTREAAHRSRWVARRSGRPGEDPVASRPGRTGEATLPAHDRRGRTQPVQPVT